VVVLADRLFDEIADTVTPQHVMAIVRKPSGGSCFGTYDAKNADWDSAGRNEAKDFLPSGPGGRTALVVLDRLQDPGNVGGVIRSAEAADFTGVVAVKGTADPFSQKVVRAASGALFRIPVRFAPDGETVLKALKERGIHVVACTMTGERPYDEATLSGNVAIIVGNEGNGLSEAFLAGADERIHIPMREGSESLNVSVAASVVMFEKARQEKRKRDGKR
jgi:TrmH family RNA methyltransferase